jgi:hydrophobic/amphiphilic exporter-1 (mainly G- bacteria), HAE1 family
MVIAFYFGVLLLAVIAIGFTMPRRLMPYVESPMVGVVSMMPGLSAEEMETYISKPIEERMVDVKGVRYIRSASQDGFSIVSVEFAYGWDMKKALFDIQSLMNVIQANLPATGANLKPSWVLAIDPLNTPVLSLNLTSDRWGAVQLRQFASNEVVNRLKTVPSVYSVVPYGGLIRQLQVIVDRNRLGAYGLSLLQVKRALDMQNVTRAAGSLTDGDRETIVRLPARALSADDLLAYPLGSWNGQVVYVRDVARVEDTSAERRSAFYYNDKEGVEVSVLQDPWASSPQVIARVDQELRRLEHEYPVRFETAYDNSRFVRILMRNMFEELGLAILLTGIAVLFFLGEWRGTLISLTTIPISLAMAILGVLAMGMTLNSSTLIGLLLCIGRLVDDSIIDIHAVERHLRMGKDPKTATIDGITEVRLAVMASTFMLMLALAPLLMTGGIVQQMFEGLVWPIILGLLASMIVSFTLTSLMAAHMLKSHEALKRERQEGLYRIVLNPVQRALDRLETGYGRLIAWMLKNRFVTLTAIFATLILGFAFYQLIGSEMMPLADVGQAFAVLEAQPGTSFAQTEQMTRRFIQILRKHPEVKQVATEIGFEGAPLVPGSTYFTGYSMGFVSASTSLITLEDKDERQKNIWQIMDSAQEEAMRTIPGLRRVQIKEMGADVMASSAAPIQILVYGKDLNLLSRLGEQVADIARQTPGIKQVATSWNMALPSDELQVDRRRALEVGLTPQDIADQTYYATRGGFTDEFYRLPNIRQNTILVRYDQRDRRNLADLEQVYLTSMDGKQVPLKTVARVEERQAPSVVEHDLMRRVISVLGYYRNGGPGSMQLAMDVVMKAQMQINWPPGYGVEIRGDMTQMMDSFKRLFNGLGLALIFIFLVLVAQFRGFLQPLQMIFSLPLELSGVFFALWLNHQSFSTVSILAVVILTGMDITTSILLVDLIMKYRERGMPRNRAVIEACPQRLRPILMTSIITIIALAPVAFWPKTGLDAYSPLGTVVVGGLIVGTFLTLLVIPIMHTLVDDLVRWLHTHVLRRPVTEAIE